jgi:hypothetical protein
MHPEMASGMTAPDSRGATERGKERQRERERERERETETERETERERERERDRERERQREWEEREVRPRLRRDGRPFHQPLNWPQHKLTLKGHTPNRPT